MPRFYGVDSETYCPYIDVGFGEGRQLSEADLTSRGACESHSLDLPRLTTRPSHQIGRNDMPLRRAPGTLGAGRREAARLETLRVYGLKDALRPAGVEILSTVTP